MVSTTKKSRTRKTLRNKLERLGFKRKEFNMEAEQYDFIQFIKHKYNYTNQDEAIHLIIDTYMKNTKSKHKEFGKRKI